MVVLINCSLRGEKSNSNYFLGLLEQQLSIPCERVHLAGTRDMDELAGKLAEAEAVVFGMPLYVDGVPSQVIEWMEYLYESSAGLPGDLRVYVVANLGFYESRQAALELAIMKNWCEKMKVVYGGGLAIGAGEMLGGLRNIPVDQGPNRQLGEAIKALAVHIAEGTAAEDAYVEPTGFSAGMYRFMADMSWGSQAKKNGVKKRELRRRR